MKNQTQYTIQRLIGQSAVVLSLGFLTACATTSPLQQKVDFDTSLPSTWQNSPSEQQAALDTAALKQWWRRFNDPQMELLIGDALANNPDIRTALSSIRQARAERGLANAGLWPTLSASAAAAGTHTSDRDNNTSSHSDNYQAAIDASWEVDLFGKQQQYVNAADADLAARTEDYRQAQVSLAAEVASTYLTLCSLEAQLDIVQQNLATRESTGEIVQWKESAGEGDALSTQQSIASTEQVRAQIPELEQSIQETQNSLAVLTGRTPAALKKQLLLPANFPSTPASITVGIPAETLRQRPDIRAVENSILAAQSRLTAAERSRLPSLNLNGSIGLDALTAGDLVDPQYVIANLVAGLSAPIWDAGRISQNIEVQTEQLLQAYLDYESAVLNALAEVENALSSIEKRSQQLATLQRAITAAKKSTELAQLQYEAGEIDLLNVLDAQRTELSLDQSLSSTQAQALNAHVQLYKALGGGWTTQTSQQQI